MYIARRNFKLKTKQNQKKNKQTKTILARKYIFLRYYYQN